MTWLAWRQSRLQFLIAACALLLLVLAFALTEPGLNHLYAEYGAHPAAFLAQVRTGGYPVLSFAGGAVMYLTPLVIGAFWGAPMIARELEAGTHRLTWNQSVTRTRWLLVKIAIGGGAAMLFVGTAGLLLSWWAGPIDRADALPGSGDALPNRFVPIIFGARDIAGPCGEKGDELAVALPGHHFGGGPGRPKVLRQSFARYIGHSGRTSTMP